MSSFWSGLKRVAIAVLAAVGLITLLGAAVKSIVFYATRSSPTGVVLGADGRPLSGVPVFLDRGDIAIERYVTDTAGRFFLPVEEHQVRRALWLICAPGAIPMIGDRELNQVGPTTFHTTPLREREWTFYRSSGWRGPIPRECPRGTDSMGWRYPISAGKSPDAFTAVEPVWDNASLSAPSESDTAR